MATMTSQTAQRPPAPAHAPTPAQGGGGFSPAAIDPVKLLKQYWPWLLAAAILGSGLGVAAHIVLKRVYPLFTATTVLKVNPVLEQGTDIGGGTVGKLGEAEGSRFMYTQVQEIQSKRNLADAVRDPAIRNDTAWAKKFVTASGTYDETRAARRLEKRVISARVVPETVLISISATTGDPKDASSIASTVAKAYLTRLQQISSSETTNHLEVLTRQFKGLENEKVALERRMQRLLVDGNIESVEFNLTDSSQKIEQLNRIISVVKQETEEGKERLSQYESLMTQPGGVTYPDYLRGEVAKEATMYVHDQQLAQLRSALQGSRARFGPNHVEVRRLEAAVRAAEQTRQQDEQRLLAEKFAALVEFTREGIRGGEAKIRESEEELRAAMTRSGELTRLIEEYTVLKTDAERKGEKMEELNAIIGDRRALLDRDISRRVTVHQQATTPEMPSFPKIEVMIPVCAVVTIGLVAGVILLRELLEQRVRTPADVALLPRMKVIGVIPDLEEDPSKPSSADTAVREQPHGAIAEQFRQMRSTVLRTCNLDGKKTIVITAGLPGSGTTMVVANMARLLASLDRKTLIIDANLRRPRQHAVFGFEEGPGLGEILAGSSTLGAATRAVADAPTLRVLTAGAKASRVYERLNSDAMTRLLEEAKGEYDVILIDTPPMTVAGDAIVVANRSDAAALVVRAFSETRGLLGRVRGQLAETRAEFLGVVVNGVKSSAGGYFRRNFQLSHEYHGAGPEKTAA